MNIILIVMVILVILMWLCVYMLFKNQNTARNHKIINNAIYKYNINKINNRTYIPNEVSQEQMEHYNKTLFRLWDWGYENIVPKEIYEKIKHNINA